MVERFLFDRIHGQTAGLAVDRAVESVLTGFERAATTASTTLDLASVWAYQALDDVIVRPKEFISTPFHTDKVGPLPRSCNDLSLKVGYDVQQNPRISVEISAGSRYLNRPF